MDVACNIKAISATHRSRYDELVNRLRAAVKDTELQDGYCYSLRSEEIALLEVAEWITMERLCCPFLTFQLDAMGDSSRLTMRGPDGVKAILREEFPSG